MAPTYPILGPLRNPASPFGNAPAPIKMPNAPAPMMSNFKMPTPPAISSYFPAAPASDPAVTADPSEKQPVVQKSTGMYPPAPQGSGSGLPVAPAIGGDSGLTEAQVRANLANAGYNPNAPKTPQQIDSAEQANRSIGDGTTTPVTPTVDSTQSSLGTDRKALEDAILGGTKLSPEEIATQTQLDNQLAALKIGQTNTEGKVIPMEFITGQEAQMAKQSAALTEPLEQKLARLQAQRTSALDASKFALDRSDKALELNKPVSLAAGSSLVNPFTGKTVAAGLSLADKQAMDTSFNLAQQYPDANITWDANKSAQENLNAAQTAASKSPRYQAYSTYLKGFSTPGGGFQVLNTKDPKAVSGASGNVDQGGLNFTAAQGATAKANADTLGVQTKALSDVRTGINTADTNFKLLIDTAKTAGVNDANSPIINGLQNAIASKAVGSGALNTFNAGIQTLRTEYARVLARGGEVTDSVRNEANQLIPSDISLANLEKVYNYIKQEGGNVIAERQAEINRLQGALPGGSNLGTAPATGSTGAGDADYQAYLKAIGQ